MTHLERPAIGAPAPPIDLPTHDGGRWTLADHLGETPILAIFHRHIH